jgi:hypothetical protein
MDLRCHMHIRTRQPRGQSNLREFREADLAAICEISGFLKRKHSRQINQTDEYRNGNTCLTTLQ